MASVTAKDIPNEQNMFTQIWNVYKKYYIPETNDSYWNGLNLDLNAIINTFQSEFCTKLCLAVEAEISRKYENQRKKGCCER